MECQIGLMRKKIAMRNPGRKPGRNPGRNPGKILMPGEIQIGMILGRNMGRNKKFNCLPWNKRFKPNKLSSSRARF